MRTLILALALVLGACGSDSKLNDQPGANNGPGQNGNGTAGTPTTENPTGPGTDTTDGGGGGGGGGDDDDTTGGGGGSSGSGEGGGGGGGGGGSDTGLTDDEFCYNAATIAGYLDQFQTAGDDKVTFCHSGGGSNYVRIDTDISACLPHLNHSNDTFPTTGCDS